MISGNTRLALHTIKGAKWRSFLTMLGVIIGVASVIVTVSLGEGVKRQVSSQINQFGGDLITVRPGKPRPDNQGGIMGVNIFNAVNTSFAENDLKVIDRTDGVTQSAPLSLLSAVPRYEDRDFTAGIVVGTSSDLPELINHKVQYGSFFSVGEEGRKVAVLGPTAAQELFQENVPVGKSFQMRGEEFIVRGVFEEFERNPITPQADFNNAVFVPYVTGKSLTDGNAQIFQIFAKARSVDEVNTVRENIRTSLTASRDNQEDFSILTQGQAVQETSATLSLITAMIAGVAAISLLVGGIGIMNIMLVSVTERTHEIGIRKAIGATNQQIMRQFLTEAVVLSLVGSVIGVVLSLIANFLIRLFTSLEPTVNLWVAGIAVGVALLVGIIFGVAPAINAARKDPIQALRYQ
jgi:putative ABC transport system permease protein